MCDIVIRANSLSKRYQIGERDNYLALRDVIAHAVSAPARIFRPRKLQPTNGDATHIWALKDVSFEVRQGEVVGIIGRNGAGKSTLLKILARVTKPTTGHAEVRGRMGSLLEVGTGFHPELTGRENTYLNGAILGMSKKEVARKFDEIVAFAEIEKFIDTPVKHYSSGMYLRLAFSVAAHLETEILLIDEILAVGDVAFQKKCLGKVGDVARHGRTVIFVSHSMSAVTSLCRIAMLLDDGEVKAIGPAARIIEEYLAPSAVSPRVVDLSANTNRRGTGEVRIIEATLRDGHSNARYKFTHGDDLCFELMLESRLHSTEVLCAILIRTLLGVPVLHLYSGDDALFPPVRVKGATKVACVLKDCKLYPGTYVVSLWLGRSPYLETDFVPDVLQFQIEQGELRRCGFDLGWSHGIFHGESLWSSSDMNSKANIVCDQAPSS